MEKRRKKQIQKNLFTMTAEGFVIVEITLSWLNDTLARMTLWPRHFGQDTLARMTLCPE